MFFRLLRSWLIAFTKSLGIDIEYLSRVAVESMEIDDIARKALQVRAMIHKTQECLRAVDRVD